eukprot:Tamp_24999.p1 GENE.Tamp_24999~~Tamp_24999.p1  ORF type:complete len:293 (+),score=50.33 Tamp_24999:46-879(+)
MAEEHSAGAERAPLIDGDDEDDAAGADPNRLSWLDVAWLVLHAAGASCDGLALRALLRRRFKGALFFGGHTQFLGNWCLCLSIASHALAIYSALAISPAPKVYNIRRHEHRDRIYHWQALASGTLVILSTVVMATQSMLLLVGEDQFQRTHVIPDLWLDFGVAAGAWMVLLIKPHRHWMGGAQRFIVRKYSLWQLTSGCTMAHTILWYYLLWVTTCRALGGRWVYRTIAAVEAQTSAFGFGVFYMAVACGLHLVAWLAWKVAHHIALMQASMGAKSR